MNANLFDLRVVACCLLLAGCPAGESARPTSECTKAYEKCVLPNGVLGICDTVLDSNEQTPPRLVCKSQH